jgi:hypothetical protein
MKNINLFKELVIAEYPSVNVNLLGVSAQGDLTYRGLYQTGYSDWLETSTHHSVQKMSPALKEVFDVWGKL